MKKPLNLIMWIMMPPVLLLTGLSLLLIFEDHSDQLTVTDRAQFYTQANELKRIGYTTYISPYRDRVCTERPIRAPHTEHRYHTHMQRYCLDKHYWTPVTENWPDTLQDIHKKMIAATDSLAWYYGF